MNTELQENVEQNFTTTKAVLAIILGVILVILAGEISSLVYKFSLPPILSPILYSALYIVIAYSFTRLCCTKILHISMNECFIGKPRIKMIWLITAIMV